MTRWFMMAGLLGAASFVANTAYAQDNTAEKKKALAKQKKGKKGKDKPDGIGPFKKGEYPTAERLRPLILPNGMGEIGLDLPLVYTSLPDPLDPITTFGIGTQFNYGIGNKVELGLQPALNFSLAPGDPAWSKLIGLRVAWLAWDSKEFDFAPAITIPLLFVEEPSIGVNIDLYGRYVLSEGWFLFFGQNALNVAVSPGFGLAINAGGGAGYQINGKTALLFGTTPLSLTLIPPGGGDADVTGIWETFNVFGTIQYSPAREWDIGLTLSPTYLVPAETFAFGADAYARFRF